MFLKLEFASKHDGTLTSIERPHVDIVFVVDISGSMGESFPNDTDRRSKLEVAKDCIMQIVDQLLPSDRVGLVEFNDRAIARRDIEPATISNMENFKATLQSMKVYGGTNLAAGLKLGYDVLRGLDKTEEAPLQILETSARAQDEKLRLRRVFFLTDMQSSRKDEEDVIKMATEQASLPISSDGCRRGSDPIYLSLVGIGVDLSVASVEKISAIPGAKYFSVVNSAEFANNVVADFNYDILPIGFNIRLTLTGGVTFRKIYGSAELNSLAPGAHEAVISTEFPVPVDELGYTHGGFYLCHIGTDNDNDDSSAGPTLRVCWTDINGDSQECTVPLILPLPLSNTSASASAAATAAASVAASPAYLLTVT
jgi:Ca-activated chloride channel family protein